MLYLFKSVSLKNLKRGEAENRTAFTFFMLLYHIIYAFHLIRVVFNIQIHVYHRSKVHGYLLTFDLI